MNFEEKTIEEPINVFIGYDSREDIAYKVCDYSIRKNSSNVITTPLKQSKLRSQGIYWREVDPLSSTEFTFTRFLVPYLMNYQGWAIFCDCDFVWTEGVEKLLELADSKYAVMVVKHDYTPPLGIKMDNQKQIPYPRKNWSSMILWNCSHPKNQHLTPDLVNEESGQYLHRFSWLEDSDIGTLSPEWNWLVNWYKEPTHGTPKAYHWTEGGPWFENYKNCQYHQVWNDYLLGTANEMTKQLGVVDKSYSPITWVTSLSRDYFNSVAGHFLPSWKNLPGDIVFVWDDKPIDLGFGKNFNFFKDGISSTSDPWLAEEMGTMKSDRFWKKSRVQVWASRKFKGLVVWLDADIMVNQVLTISKMMDLLKTGDNVWGTLDAGGEWDLDTGIVAFNTGHPDFSKFLRDYSTMWYNGKLAELPQPYDHYVASYIRKKWPATSYVDHYNTWNDLPDEFINRHAMKNSKLKHVFTHYLGIENKDMFKGVKTKK